MIDSLRRHLAQARESGALERLGVRPHAYGLVTLHRPSNVDDPERLADILGALETISRDLPLLFPVHPRTRARLEAAAPRATDGRVQLLEPLSYLDFLCLMAASAVALTDSGGIQEETTVLGVPCLTLRENTERPVTIEQGTNRLAGTTSGTILAAWEESKRDPKPGRIPELWDGQAAQRCLEALRAAFG